MRSRQVQPVKPIEMLNTAPPTFTLLELPGYAGSFQDLYDDLEGDVIAIDLDDDDEG